MENQEKNQQPLSPKGQSPMEQSPMEQNPTEQIQFEPNLMESQQSLTEQQPTQAPKEEDPKSPKIPSLRVGIISTPVYREDLMSFNEVFVRINEQFGDDVTLVVFGYDGSDDMPELMDGIKYEYAKPVNMIHYFKQLKALNLDCILIPLINNEYNATSEKYNKYLEASAFSIPVICTNILPYNNIIQDGMNGFLFRQKQGLIGVIKYLLSNRHMLKFAGDNAHRDMLDTFDFTPENIDMVIDIYN